MLIGRIVGEIAADVTDWSKGVAAVVKSEATLSKVVGGIQGDFKRIGRDVGRAADLVKRGGRAIAGAMRKAGSGVAGLAGKVSGAVFSLKGLVAAAAGSAVVGSTLGKLSQIKELQTSADLLGITTESLSRLGFAAKSVGVDTEGLVDVIKTNMELVSEAAVMGSGTAAEALAELGLDANKVAAMMPDDRLRLFANELTAVGDQSDRVRLAIQLFGDEGSRLLPALTGGAAGLEAMAAEADALGLTLDSVDAAKAAEAAAAVGKIGAIVEGLANQAAVMLAPAIESIAELMTDWFKGAKQDGEQLGGVLEGIAKTVGVIGDVFETVGDIWNLVQSGILNGLGYVAGGVNSLVGGFHSAISAIGDFVGVDFGAATEGLAQFTEILAEDMRAAGAAAHDRFAEGFTDRTFSERITNPLIDKLKNAPPAELPKFKPLASADISEGSTVLNDLAAGFRNIVNDTAATLVDAGGKLAGRIAAGGRAVRDEIEAVKVDVVGGGGASLVEVGTAAAFSTMASDRDRSAEAAAKMLEQQKRQAIASEAALGVLRDIAEGITGSSGTFSIPPA